jgi:hypothetical protein
MFSPFAGPNLKKMLKSPLQTLIEPAETIDYFYAFCTSASVSSCQPRTGSVSMATVSSLARYT